MSLLKHSGRLPPGLPTIPLGVPGMSSISQAQLKRILCTGFKGLRVRGVLTPNVDVIDTDRNFHASMTGASLMQQDFTFEKRCCLPLACGAIGKLGVETLSAITSDSTQVTLHMSSVRPTPFFGIPPTELLTLVQISYPNFFGFRISDKKPALDFLIKLQYFVSDEAFVPYFPGFVGLGLEANMQLFIYAPTADSKTYYALPDVPNNIPDSEDGFFFGLDVTEITETNAGTLFGVPLKLWGFTETPHLSPTQSGNYDLTNIEFSVSELS